MMRLRGLKPIVLLLALPTVLSCAQVKAWLAPQSPSHTPPARDAVRSPRLEAERARKHMATGEYQKALADYRAALRHQPLDRKLADDYVQSLAKIAAAADKALERQDFVAAGRHYIILLDNQEQSGGLTPRPPYDPARLRENLDVCRKALYKLGFQQYRAGNLNGAIGLWENLLAIDPQNVEVQETLRTARLQRKNLQATD